MEMITDSFFLIGSTHTICEDYAYSGKFTNLEHQEMSYVIISDGCSASDHVDLGARLLVHSAIDEIKRSYQSPDVYNDCSAEYIDSLVGDGILKNSKKALDVLGDSLDEYALDATLLYAVSDGSKTFINAYGDGNIVIKTAKETKIINIEFETGAPYYLSYLLSDDRRYNYQMATESHEMKKIVTTTTYDNNFKEIDRDESRVDFDNSFYLTIDEPLISVSVLSDGVETYKQYNESAEKVLHDNLSHSVEQLTSFKNYGEDFVKRRVNAYHRKGANNKLEHSDDVSIATIVFKDNLGI
jgi:hypothetical protein